ncbi:MAG: RagB/SusD family nutrient uptake outer membrane protein [Muribaculaceae bacterium]|nr:RagB/SusD family nutrient uptake outer membrane protein [Muribaculaceae bacterium]
MKISKIFIPVIGLGLALASCDDYLDVSPVDQIDDADYWKTEEHIRTFALGSYTSYFTGYAGNYGYNEKLTDNFSDRNQQDWEYLAVSATDGNYTHSYVRRANYLIAGVERVPNLDDATRNHWLGVGRLLRGIEYCDLCFNYGDIQWYTTCFNSTDIDSLYRPRDSRDKYVMPRVLSDLRFALENIRENDGELQINRYVAAAMIARAMLREGTFEKYHNINQDMARECLQLAKDACLVVMNNSKYSLSPSYSSLFVSEDLSSNSEVLIWKAYSEEKSVFHSVLTYNNNQSQTGVSRDFCDAFLRADGLPFYYDDPDYCPKTDEEYFADRDARLTMVVRPKYYIAGCDVEPFNLALSGFSMHKYMDDSKGGLMDAKYTATSKNITACPQYRLGEVLVTYAEVCYELGSLTQNDLDISINVLRDRADVEMPHLQVIGGNPAVGGVTYDDPKRDPDVPSMLWEIRRERRVELAFEGSRLDDLKRWKKLIYLWADYNPNICYGAWIDYADYPNVEKSNAVIEGGETSGYLLVTTGNRRSAPQERNYIRPIPQNEITIFAQNGFTLEQNPQWK